MLKIRKAKPTDAEQAAPLIIDAIGDIAERVTGETEAHKIKYALCTLFKREDNPSSHLFTYMAELNGKVIGTMVAYSGKKAPKLDANHNAWLAKKGDHLEEIDAESLPDEFYIDTICIDPEFRGKGIGTKFFAFAEDIAKQKDFSKVSLNVETQKEAAIRLYKRLGYKIVSPWTIIGEPFHHMVKLV